MNLKNIKIPPIHRIIGRFFARFHVVTFTVVVIGGLAFVTYTLNEIIISSFKMEASAIPQQEMPDFDQTTIDRVNNLNQSSGETKALDLPANKRSNPFTE